jgi:membrane protein
VTAWVAQLTTLAGHLWRFSVRVIKSFLDNQGILLAGSIAYNGLLSAIPLFAVLVMALSYFIDEALLLQTIAVEVKLLIPTYADEFVGTIETLLEARSLISGVGIVVLLFFSSIAFRMLEEAIANIFHVPDHVEDRSFWMSALIPYVYMVVIGIAIVLVTTASAVLEGLGERTVQVVGFELAIDNLPAVLLYVSGFVGLVAMFASIYKVLPIIRVSTRRALVGGLVAALLWEVVRRILVWYFASISLVNIIYGSLATVIVVLLSMEVGAIILLLGGQVIAELERSAAHDLAWHEAPGQSDD